MIDHSLLNELRNLILLKIDITIISPSDCQHIALAISRKLNKKISDTTIKRLFGFAAVKYNFSKFTINTLLEFVEHPSLLNKSDEGIKNSNDKKDAEQWIKITANAKKISQKTVKHIVNHCTIPYRYTINRQFATDEFQYFYDSNYSFTSFIAQPGYGKSILLSQIVSNLFLKQKDKYNNDILLFINAPDLFRNEHDHLNFDTELKRVLDVNDPQPIINLFHKFHEKTGHKVIIIIDAFYDLFHLNKNKSVAFEAIINWLCEIEDGNAIKLVVSMRSYLWARFHTLIRNSHYLTKTWYPGNNYVQERISNVPPLTELEVENIISNMNPKLLQHINSYVKEKLSNPFYFKYYYHLKDEYDSNVYHTNLIFFEIYLRFIFDQIYKSHLSPEKLVVCKKIIQFSDYGLKSSTVNKALFFNDFFLFKQAYMDLLAEGIIIEHKKILNDVLVETVGFVHHHFFDYFLYKELAEREPNFTVETLDEIIKNYSPTRSKKLIKWMIFSAIRNSKYAKLQIIAQYQGSIKNELTLFTTENIKHQLKLKPNDAIEANKYFTHQKLPES